MKEIKKILIIHSNMKIGGAETSLIGVLDAIDYSKYSVDLFLYEQKGELISKIPREVNLLKENKKYRSLMLPIKEVAAAGVFGIAFARILAKIKGIYKVRLKGYTDSCYIIKQYAHKYALPFLPKFNREYDLAISFIDPHFILDKKVKAKVKLGWIHTDFSRIVIDTKVDYKMWDQCDKIICVSSACKKTFDEKHPNLSNKSMVIENILSRKMIYKMKDCNVEKELEQGSIKLLSIGRFSKAKNFDNVPAICEYIIKAGKDVRWYIIGYGGDEELIRKKIADHKMQEYIILLGKKTNPYPYIQSSDIYIQPSRYEGKSVTVREAQILNKPVIITNYKTAYSQLEDGIDGIIVPLDNRSCAEGIISLINNKNLQRQLYCNTANRDYTNKYEIVKIYDLLDGK